MENTHLGGYIPKKTNAHITGSAQGLIIILAVNVHFLIIIYFPDRLG